ncbi:response regulator [Paenibacillus assamensis]|uniref:response regulator n=1 Tax=Paenibacillus assamensis TaxID=311244 RepID=UPI000426875A|nr:response regulator [Paenibacillus assamensis]
MNKRQPQINEYRVLLIEDDPMVQEVNRQFVENVTGFRVEGIAGNGVEGLKLVRDLEPDLVFLDMFMPVQDGVETLRQIRAEALPVDVIVVTAAKDLPTVKNIMQKGVFDYVIKPFKFERIAAALEQYRAYRQALHEERHITQAELDAILRSTTTGFVLDAGATLPKGLQSSTMRQVIHLLQHQRSFLTAEEVADGVGLARVTARRYLEYLVQSGSVRLDIRYGSVGRPVNRYGLLSSVDQHERS